MKIKLYLVLGGLAAIAISVVMIVINISTGNVSENIGTAVGSTIGNTVGNAVGTINGLTIDAANGFKDGRQEGLSAKDTTVSVKESLMETGSLQVLEAGVKIVNLGEYSDKYKNLTCVMGELLFSVDLTQAKILADEDGYIVQIPHPTPRFYLDDTGTKTYAVVDKSTLFDGSALDGIEAELNTRNMLEEKFEQYIEEYDDISKQADSAARTQVMSMLNTLNVGGKKLKRIEFIEEVEDK